MASRCRKCGQQVPRNPPFTAVRITEGEMKSYHDFIGGCIRLERMTKKDEIMQQEIRPLVAVDIIEQLHRQFAILSGGRGKDGAPIITFPEFAGFSDIPDEDFLNVVTYLTSIPSLEAASIGFIIIIDRRRDKWSAVKASLTRIAGAFPGNLQLVFVLRPSRFIQRTIADIGIKLYRDDFKMKVPIIMLNSVSDLHGYIDKSQLTRELGGTLEYGHSQWIHHRTAIENFAMTVKTTAQMLQTFGTDLAETELPNDVQCTEELLCTHTDHHSKLKDELKLAVKQGATLLTCIREPVTRSANSKLSPDELENVATVERLLAQLDETEKAFDQFWTKHHLKLEQCLQLRHFEHDFREVKLALDNLMEAQAAFADIGDSVTRVEHLLREQKQLEEKGQEPLEKAQSLALHGEQLIQNNHYAVDSIRPKCVELRRICDDFTNETKKKCDILGKSLELHKQLDKASQWCEAGIYLLASQAVDKCQSQEGAETALVEIEKFLVTAKEHQLSNPKEFYNQFDMILTPEIKANAQRILQKLEDVQEMFDKRQVSLKKLAAKQTRPVQPVAPHPESSPKRASPKITRPAGVATNRRSTEISCPPKTISEVELSKKKNIKKSKGGIKIEVMHEASQGGSSRVLVMSESDENLSTRRSHIINELIETERVYVEELQSIIEGYASEMDNPNLVHLIPSALQNKKEILFGNLPEIYEFHNRIFLKEIENCIENPELLARCFLKRKEDLQIYEKYCQNKPRSEALWRQCGDSIFFQECQRKLDHKLSLDAYLLKPVQRITKYQLLLKEMLKCSKNSEGTAELEEALATVLDIIKSVNDSMHQIAITGYEGDVSELGKLLMQGSFNVWTDHKKGHNKVKDLARFKPMQRHLFLYTKMLLFCKKREENTDGHEKTASYSFKNSLKMSTVGITENVKGDNKKFEIWYNGREEVYIIQASSVELKNTWISEIRKVLTGQLEACREASQLHQRITESVYHAPMDSSNASRYSRKSSSIYENKSETSNVEASNNKNRNSSPSARQKRDPESKEREVTRRFSLASSTSTTVNSSAVTKGPLVPAVKVKRHEIKSDPTPLGFEDAFENTILAQTKCNTGSTARPVPRSASQTGWPSRQMPSLDTFEDFEAIPSSTDELSNSSDLEEETNPNNGTNLFRVEGSFDSCFPDSLTFEDGDLVQFVQEGENGQWLVKKLVSEKSDWVPSSILQPAEGESNNLIKNSNADMYNDSCSTASVESDTKESEVAKSFPAEQRAGS
ncbi:probable guanine nucleotide exchange factor MCF2L2 isoform X1 [Falco biarmicus]|uniref:probable guanine nucleotide exchange factor MCF2L2 isoform X1 n=1 Tax=Falco peregrinus TaxID=8954 RepID=UPI000FFB8948|nr:probable guanine nucleotide exchange factor MCF2L2 isoform X1 [Falco peregrinus]XP_027660056.1 probable guanine nucleotide exchange factor MCF2L2 isoform X1 [Falco cherrug]XP_037262887.1 probable guanine nucleotide exchange factor MCF2L2 isoform X4 [Falco rusticolus]XP_056214553.1 probable guanine nucleotide exchange factor MCF2L2 isoform X1 [Falco biarmicus]